MSNAPEGRGMFIWNVKSIYNGKIEKILAVANLMKLDWVAVKINNGVHRSNYPWPGPDYAKKLIEVFHANGIDVHGWQYVYLKNGLMEGRRFVQRARELGVKGVIMDVEGHVKHADNQMQETIKYCQEITKFHNDGIPVGFSSYRYPSYHHQIPYVPFLDVSTYITPQVYWMKADNPVYQLERSKKEYDELHNGEFAHLPFVPTGAAFTEWGWKPRKQELIDFNKAVIEKEYPAINWWRFGHAVQLGLVSIIRNMPSNYGGEPAPLPPIGDHFVNTAPLNIRSEPGVTPTNDIGTLALGSDVTVVERSSDGWGKIEGWVSMNHLDPTS